MSQEHLRRGETTGRGPDSSGAVDPDLVVTMAPGGRDRDRGERDGVGREGERREAGGERRRHIKGMLSEFLRSQESTGVSEVSLKRFSLDV